MREESRAGRRTFDKVDVAEEKNKRISKQGNSGQGKVSKLENNRLAFLRVREKTLHIYARTGHPMNTLLYNDLGFAPSALTPDAEREDVLMEVIPEIAADYKFTC